MIEVTCSDSIQCEFHQAQHHSSAEYGVFKDTSTCLEVLFASE